MTTSSSWSPMFLLPNLRLQSPIESASCALLPSSDPRVEAFASQHLGFAKFLRRFTDAFKVRLSPAVLMLRKYTSLKSQPVEAAAAFRNLVALSVVAYARASLATHSRYSGIFWADAFKFHPWMVGRDNEYVVAQSPAFDGLHLVEEFHGQASPEVPLVELSHRTLDRPLFDELTRRWERCFGDGRRRSGDIRLFRSLNMAYNASLIPTTSRETLVVDVGRLLALWVSAFEILVHPGADGRATCELVLNVLDDQPQWNRSDIREMTCPVSAGRGKPARPHKLPAWFYARLYQARNDFFHGNRVTATSHRVEPRGKKSLLNIAAPLYRFALSSVLRMQAPPHPSGTFGTEEFAKQSTTNGMFLYYQNTHEQALVASLGKATYRRLFGRAAPTQWPESRRRRTTLVRSV